MAPTKPVKEEPRLLITLKRSPIGVPQKRRQILRGLGLRRMLQSVNRPDTDQVRGLIEKVRHMVEVRRP